MSPCKFRARTETHWGGWLAWKQHPSWMSVRKPQAPETDTGLTSFSQDIQTLLGKRKSHTVGILEDISQMSFATSRDGLSASGRPLIGSRGWIRHGPPSSGESPTSTSGQPAPLLSRYTAQPWLAAASLWRLLMPPFMEMPSVSMPTISILSHMFLVFTTTLSDMTLLFIVYPYQTEASREQGPQPSSCAPDPITEPV